ncbi:GlxA family transcriptional regulator [Dactylosporangium cerinum]|uniref:GlxA family transcriptional regulator n=1 Tax=Dactylosporangium cerinum TaxID=1434730 RepID=A0ABV9WAR7_9ACTN
MAFVSIAVYAPPGVAAFGLGLVAEVFGDRRHLGLPGFDVSVCADAPGPVRTDLGLPLHVEWGLDRLSGADLVFALPGNDFRDPPSAASLDAFRAAHARGAIVASHCVGAYLLAAAGLLDGRRATTHWRFAAGLAARYPSVTVDPDVLYVDEDRVVTGAGAAAGVDLCLHLLRREHGAAVANAVARDLVVPPHRDGGQAQYVAAPVATGTDDERLGAVLAWARANLHRRTTIDELAGRALTSRRTFIRRFRDVTGATPHAWLLTQRLNQVEELLEVTDLSIEEIAHRTGFSSAAVLREQFVRRRGVPPRDYRRTFVRG